MGQETNDKETRQRQRQETTEINVETKTERRKTESRLYKDEGIDKYT
jgi:hypothetical protein